MAAGRPRTHSVFLHSVNERLAHRRDEVRILAERTHPDHGIAGVVIHVEHGRERHVNAQRATLCRSDAAFLVGERRISRGADAHLVGEHRAATEIDVVRQEVAPALAEGDAGFVVSADDERQTAQSLHRVQLVGRLDR